MSKMYDCLDTAKNAENSANVHVVRQAVRQAVGGRSFSLCWILTTKR